MRKLLAITLTLLVVVGGIALIASNDVVAASSPAVVINPPDGLCGFEDGNGQGFFTTDTKIVDNTNGKNGMLRCQGTGVPNSTGKAVTFRGPDDGNCIAILPVTGFVVTNKWHETLSASGKATLSCHFPG